MSACGGSKRDGIERLFSGRAEIRGQDVGRIMYIYVDVEITNK